MHRPDRVWRWPDDRRFLFWRGLRLGLLQGQRRCLKGLVNLPNDQLLGKRWFNPPPQSSEIRRVQDTPLLIQGIEGVVEVACGSSFNIARCENGEVVSWGVGRLHSYILYLLSLHFRRMWRVGKAGTSFETGGGIQRDRNFEVPSYPGPDVHLNHHELWRDSAKFNRCS